ncbi:hypothetical protein J4234_01070 [Candidatus Woesearchaeota archaeon]|nr:hypothetical protein [Candidatus Woesearchaeota archaeon]
MAAEALQLEGFVRTLERWGLTDVLLPFLLIFVIVYAVLQKTKILGETKKNLNVVVAVIVGLLVVIPHVTGGFPPNADPVEIMNEALPQISIVLVAIIFLLLMIGVFGQDYVFLGVTMPGWITLVSLIIIVLIFGGAAGWWDSGFGTTLENFFGTEGIAIFIMLLVFGIIIAWITSDSKEREDRTILNRLGMDFSKLFGKK